MYIRKYTNLPALALVLTFAFIQLSCDPTDIADESKCSLRLNATDFGVVLKHGWGDTEYDILGARDAFVFQDDSSFYLHYDAAGAKGWVCALAVSSDLFTWVKYGPVLELGQEGRPDSRAAAYGSVFKSDSTFYMYYIGAEKYTHWLWKIPKVPYVTCLAKSTSPSGPWEKLYDQKPFELGDEGTEDEYSVAPGQVIFADDEYHMFYSPAGKTPASFRMSRTIGRATAKHPSGPWKKQKKTLLPTSEYIENASLYYEPENGYWFLFTNHVSIKGDADRSKPVALGRDRPVEYTDAIWVYWSKNYKKWDPDDKAVVLDSGNVTWDTAIIGLPSVIAHSDTLWIFYDGRSTSDVFLGYWDGRDHMHRDIGLACLPLPLTPPEM